MNAIVNQFLLEGDKFMPEMHLRQPGFKKSLHLLILPVVLLLNIGKEFKNL